MYKARTLLNDEGSKRLQRGAMMMGVHVGTGCRTMVRKKS